MTTTYNLSISKNPQFQTVTGLTNQTFNRNNIVSGQMATEAQIQQLWQDIIRLEERIDYCCRDIVFWDVQVRIRDKFGNIITDFLENRSTGIARRGKNFTMTFPIKAAAKYENHWARVNNSNDYAPDDTNRVGCYVAGRNSQIENMCGLFYRGTSGQYYEMSERKTTGMIAVGATNITATGSAPFAGVFRVDLATGNEINYYNALPGNTHFAYAAQDGTVTINVLHPITTASGDAKASGRIYRFDWRDVTLGG